MKGVAQWGVAAIVIIVYVAVSILGMFMHKDAVEDVNSQTYIALSVLNYAESLKRTVSSAANIAILNAVEGVDETNFEINKERLRGEIGNELKIDVNEIDGKKITWGKPIIKEISLLNDGSGFIVSGSYPFSITNAPENPVSVYEMNGNFRTTILFVDIS